MDISIIIVNYNVEHFLDHCLHSVTRALKNVRGEVIVVDNNSVDGSVEMVGRKHPGVRLIPNLTNKGFSGANNQAIPLCTGRYILLLNPDTLVEEDTFSKSIAFMDAHADAGALGVKMINGKGAFLPESKRSLPTPFVAFCKIFGLSALFPGSRAFGRYHLGYLNKDQTHKVEVLSGAFMMLRKSVLDKTGLLDESFFMYGEDIDLSYRILRAGYFNYYYPEARIIHYKGESTRKSSVNYVFVFYKAMIIFAKKHFTSGNAGLFAFLINLAIYLRAGVAVLNRIIKGMALPLFDACVMFFGIYFIKNYYEENFKYTAGGSFPEEFIRYVLPCYILIWLGTVFLSGGYDKPIRLSKILRGVIIGTGLILVLYALLPESLRFSRIMIFLGAAWTGISLLLSRSLLHFSGLGRFRLDGSTTKRIAVAGSIEECSRVDQLLKQSGVNASFTAYVSPGEVKKAEFTGTLSQLGEICSIYKIEEVIFCSKDISAQVIIDQMISPSNPDIDFKIAPPESLSVIGSNSIDTSGDLYVIETNSVSKPVNRRNKRIIDLLFTLVCLAGSPLLMFIVKDPLRFLVNSFGVLFGKLSWVGFAEMPGEIPVNLPHLRRGVLHPGDTGHNLNTETIKRLNMLYARDYRAWNDLSLMIKGIRKLGRKV